MKDWKIETEAYYCPHHTNTYTAKDICTLLTFKADPMSLITCNETDCPLRIK